MTSINVLTTEETYLGKKSLKVSDNGDNTSEICKINNLDFKNGIIEIDVSGKPAEKCRRRSTWICWYRI
ncbi:MAG: hypothetical protein IPF54_21645 [Draconibacterium sp.]|nr:hypothetical protein [Draconibacterium sp.]